jgi:hypothetical protein
LQLWEKIYVIVIEICIKADHFEKTNTEAVNKEIKL